MKQRRVHFWVTGRVQGVYFRESTRGWAEKLGIVGWVKNLADGRVEGVVQGDRQAIELILERIKVGPPLARVAALEIVEEDPSVENNQSFEVSR